MADYIDTIKRELIARARNPQTRWAPYGSGYRTTIGDGIFYVIEALMLSHGRHEHRFERVTKP